MMRKIAIFLGLIGSLLLGGVARAQQDAPAPAPPPQVQELMRLLQDPVVRGWMEQQRPAATPEPRAPSPPASTPATPVGSAGESLSFDLTRRLERIRVHFHEVVAALPRLPAEFANGVALVRTEMQGIAGPRVLLLLATFIALGYGSELLFRRATRQAQTFVVHQPIVSAAQRLRAVGMRFLLGVAGVVVFAIGSLGAFLLLAWPPLLKHMVVGYLVAVIMLRAALMLLDVALALPRANETEPERFRLLPIPTDRARFWHRRIALFVGYFAFGWITVQLMAPLGFSLPSRFAVAYLLGLGLLAIALEALWRRPHAAAREGEGGTAPAVRTSVKAALTIYAIALWLLWVAGLGGLFWLAALATLLPTSISLAQRAVTHLMRPVDGDAMPSVERGVREVVIDRGVRLVLIVAAVLWLAHVLQIDLVALTARDTGATRLVRGVLTGIVVLLLADLLWQMARAAIDTKLREREVTAPPGTPEAVRQARLRTLLPIFRNMLLVLIAVMAILTALAALGVDIAPLIAGAGVFGVAIGFGSQTLVRDVISGVFYLLDDAFRVGEYIQSGTYKGTVESFSLRSVKLRHHRGPLYTVPFGQLGAVQNMSRDWVIDKITVSVTYDTDLEKARKLIKKVGQELAADPEFADKVIEPLKMQGVERFGEYAIEIRMKMMTKPGEQFTIRRKALARIKTAFDEAGIKFAFPTVQVASGDDSAAAAAQQMLESKKAADAQAAA